jgi:NAD(P)-dependent dehydrogenase (short-subunit alcohol dehydrogenase family)
VSTEGAAVPETLEQRAVVVIGGGSGIGREVARRAAAEGARVTIVGRDRTRLEAAARELGQEVDSVALDAHDEAAVQRFFYGLDSVDHVVSMVGDSMSGGFLDTAAETMRKVLHSKFWSNWVIGRSAAARVREGGSLTFTSGTGGRPHEISATYVANLGIGALVEGLAAELAPRVRVNAVAPTFMGTATSFWRDVPAAELRAAEADFAAGVPLGRLGTIPEVASTYLALITNGFITGQTVAVDGGVMLRK